MNILLIIVIIALMILVFLEGREYEKFVTKRRLSAAQSEKDILERAEYIDDEIVD